MWVMMADQHELTAVPPTAVLYLAACRPARCTLTLQETNLSLCRWKEQPWYHSTQEKLLLAVPLQCLHTAGALYKVLLLPSDPGELCEDSPVGISGCT